MGRKGGGIGSGRNQVVLLRRLEASKHHYKSLDEAVQYLQSTYPDYRRLRTAILTPNVSKALQQQSQRKNNCKTPEKPSPARLQFEFSEEDHDNTESSGSLMPSGKKLKRTDEREKKLIERENDHIRRRRGKQHGESTSESSDSESQSESDSDSVGGASTSEDGIYGEKVVPEFDLMNSMLRKSYNGSKPAGVKMEENNMEVEDTSREKKLALLGGQGSGQKDSKSTVADGRELKGSEGVEMKAKEGPRFSDLGGMNAVLEELKMEVIVPLYHPQLPTWLGVRPMAGILLHGPPGCGKTKLAHAIATETGLPFYQISATEVVSGVSGASEENIRELFSKAYRTAPSIVFIDEIDAIASKRENLQREMERRIVTQLMTCMDESHRLVKSAHKSADLEGTEDSPGYVLVIGATNRPDAVDPALRRPGRFDREIVLGVPDENGRVQILSVLIRNLRVEGTFDLLKIARMTPGFVGADLAALANKAGNIAMKRIIDQRKSELSKETVHEEHGAEWWRQPWLPEEMEKLSITMADFEEAVKMIQPSSRREGFSTTPNVKWEDVGGLDVLRQEFERYIVRRINHPEEYEDFGVDLETGFLLYGPPGCGKTLIAKAVATEAGANFIHIKGPELLNKYVGESELAVRTIFSRARTCSPCILFFDEVDALTTKRGKEGGWVVERLLNQLLIELDGAEQRRGVYVIGATNRPEVMDRAVLRPGRFGKLLYVPLPSPEERGLILKALSRKKPLDSDVDLLAIGRSDSCADLSGADLSALMNEAAMAALEEKLSYELSSADDKTWSIKSVHFEQALKKVTPSVSDKEKGYYEHLSHNFHAA